MRNKYMQRKSSIIWLASLLLVCLGATLFPSYHSQAASEQSARQDNKVSLDLRQKADKGRGNERVRVIIQPVAQWSSELDGALKQYGGSHTGQFKNFKMRIVNLPVTAALALAARADVAYVSLDREVKTLGHVSLTTGADGVRNANGTTTSGLDGTGIGIALLDSGIDTSHRAFLDKSNNLRIIVSQDFTGEGRTDDPYGHGTHVAATAGGNGRISNAQYIGIAPNANLINLRVLDSQGAGTVGNLLRAMDWVLSNRAAYNIRVVNMSLGAPAIDSYKNDPVCLAVRRLVNAGVVVAVAAGNNGKDASGNKIYGHIHSPGNEPSAITVGAANTFGTNARGDDAVTSYSSRGPTRSFWTDGDNVRHYDNLVKPDLVAPGNKIIYAEAVDNLLVMQNPQLDAGVSPVDNRRMMYLNGTSMATPVTAGAAALLLQANPTLSPNLVKALLMYTAQPLAGFNMFEQGAGELNIEGAVRLAKLVRTDLSATTRAGSS